MNIKSFINNKESKNAFWIIAGKVSQILISFLVSIWSTKYLGPSNYGLLSYVSAYVAFFTSFCTLGITSSIVIKEFTDKPELEGQTLGTTIGLRLISSLLSSVTLVALIIVIDKNDRTLNIIAALTSISLVFQVLDTFEYWFQKRYMSKVTSIASFIAYCITALYRVVLLITKRDVFYFALANSVDYLVVAIILFAVYKKNNGPKLSFSMARAKEIFLKSYNFILSGMMVAIYGQTDKIMLKQMISEIEVGYYSLASNLSTRWAFVLGAIISSVAPTIVKYKSEGNEKAYLEKNIQLYRIIFYLSLFVSVLFLIFAPLIIEILYGDAYLNSITPLRVISWYVAFSYLGVARDIWLVCENKQKYSKYMYLFAVFINIGLNLIFIPSLGATGAALASLITQTFTSIGIPLFFKEMRPNVKLIFKAIFCWGTEKRRNV